MKNMLPAIWAVMKKLVVVSAILLLLIIAWCVLWYFIDSPHYPERRQAEETLAWLLQHIQLGDTPDVVLQTYHESPPKNLQLFRDESLWRVHMVPTGLFSESDWVLYIAFQENVVTTVYVRSSDGPYKPAGSPDDKGETPPVISP